MTARCVAGIAAAALLGVTGLSARAQPVSWPDTFVGRLEALALVQTLNAELLASVGALPAGTTAALPIPDALFAHRAVLYTRDHVPFSEVYEIYQREILAFPPPRK